MKVINLLPENVKPSALQDLSSMKESLDFQKAKEKSQEFEAMFVSYLYNLMFDKIPVDEIFGGGKGEKIFRSILTEENIKNISKQSGFGIQDKLLQEIIKHQEVGK